MSALNGVGMKEWREQKKRKRKVYFNGVEAGGAHTLAEISSNAEKGMCTAID